MTGVVNFSMIEVVKFSVDEHTPVVCHDSTVQSSATLIDAARAPEALRAPSRAFTGLCVRQGRDCDQAVVPTPRLASKPVSHYFLSYLSQTQTGPLLLVP